MRSGPASRTLPNGLWRRRRARREEVDLQNQSFLVAKGLTTPRSLYRARWWAHLEFTPINIELTILRKKIEDLLQLPLTRIAARPAQKATRTSTDA